MTTPRRMLPSSTRGLLCVLALLPVRAQALPPPCPRAPTTTERQQARVEGYIAKGKEQGAPAPQTASQQGAAGAFEHVGRELVVEHRRAVAVQLDLTAHNLRRELSEVLG